MNYYRSLYPGLRFNRGDVYSRLTVLERAGYAKTQQALWKVKCECGKIKVVYALALRAGRTASCGCIQIENLIKRNETHGLTYSPLYMIWASMKRRCYNENTRQFPYYGARGVKVCAQWIDDFKAFHDDMRPTWQPGLELDRIDNDGNYEPNNCKWSTHSEQMKNRRPFTRT